MLPMLDNIAARLRITVTDATLTQLYQLGVIRPDHEPEDLAGALARLAQAAVEHGLSLGR